MSEPGVSELVARLMELTARYGLEELEAAEGDLQIRLAAAEPAGLGGETPLADTSAYLWQPPALPAIEPPSLRPPTARPLLAPLTGHFYRGPSPDLPPFVEQGQAVEEGQRVGLIEAMKVFSEVLADRSGTIVEISAPNGKLVQHGEVLMWIDPGPAE